MCLGRKRYRRCVLWKRVAPRTAAETRLSSPPRQVFDGAGTLSDKEQAELTRWAALQAYLLLKRNDDALEAVVHALNENSESPSDSAETLLSSCLRALERADDTETEQLRRRNRERKPRASLRAGSFFFF